MIVGIYLLLALASLCYFSWGYALEDDPDSAFVELAMLAGMAALWPFAWTYVLWVLWTRGADE